MDKRKITKYDFVPEKKRTNNKGKIRFEKAKMLSQFHVVLNTNITYKKMNKATTEWKENLFETINDTMEYWVDNIDQFIFCDNLNYGTNLKNKKVISHEFNLEVGNKNGQVHLDGFINFDGYCKINLPKSSKFFNEALAEFTPGTYLKVRYYRDNKNIIKEYSRKEKYDAEDVKELNEKKDSEEDEYEDDYYDYNT